MTPEQHRLRIQDIERMLYKADHGMGMPRDPQRVKELQAALADARLIAAAPDLLWAVKSAILWIEATAEMAGDVEAAGEYLAKLRATIAKAEGCCQFHTSGGDNALSCGGDIAKAEGTS